MAKCRNVMSNRSNIVNESWINNDNVYLKWKEGN